MTNEYSGEITQDGGRLLDRFAKRAVLTRLGALKLGQLNLLDGDFSQVYGARSVDDDSLEVTLEVFDQSFYADFAFGGTTAAGEAYMRGSWRCSDLTTLVRIMIKNADVLDALDNSWLRVKAPLFRIAHWFNRNTQVGSRRNIQAHYDLGNDMFKLFLDSSMMYSCAYYPCENSDLEAASEAKLKRICDKLQLSKADRVVEIGTGWGGFAIYAARNYGCHVTTTTISDEQHALAAERIAAAGLTDSITLLKQDYRDLNGHYDKLVSIEMIEAVGPQFLETYLRCCSDLLKPHGVMLIQAITMCDQRYDRAVRSVDFIQRYIFPGGFIPCVSAIAEGVKQATDMRLFHLEDIGPHYATTLRDWRDKFNANLEAIRAQGYSEDFIRMWEFYLCYSEGGFIERVLGNAQVVLIKPDNRIDWRLSMLD